MLDHIICLMEKQIKRLRFEKELNPGPIPKEAQYAACILGHQDRNLETYRHMKAHACFLLHHSLRYKISIKDFCCKQLQIVVKNTAR